MSSFEDHIITEKELSTVIKDSIFCNHESLESISTTEQKQKKKPKEYRIESQETKNRRREVNEKKKIEEKENLVGRSELLLKLGYYSNEIYSGSEFHPVEKELPFNVEGLIITKIGEPVKNLYLIQNPESRFFWNLDSNILLSEEDLERICHLTARLAPNGSTARLQSDAHIAGSIFVGLVLSFDHFSIPINLVSGDIGCGLSMIPFVDRSGFHKNFDSSIDNSEYHSFVLACIRRSLKRGQAAERGVSFSDYIHSASEFYGAEELETWLNEMMYVLEMCGMDYGTNVLDFIGKFSQSLGSSGNHFMELSVDDFGKYWIVVHSGSRGLGAKIYDIIAEACRRVTSGYGIATGNLAVFYARAYDALNKFAKLNRIVCALAVLDDLRMCTDIQIIRDVMMSSEIFAPAISLCSNPDSITGLLGGLTHNGIKAFVNHKTRQVIYILSKGAITLPKSGGSGIVALRAGEGCVVFTLVDPMCDWIEIKNEESILLGYQTVYECDGLIFAGHGAGRNGSTSQTASRSNFSEILNFFDENGMVGNIAPGVLGDNPKIAYKPSSEILPKLPLDISITNSRLRTLVSHKEGISFKKSENQTCAKFIIENMESRPLASIIMDINLVQSFLGNNVFASLCNSRDSIMEILESKYRV